MKIQFQARNFEEWIICQGGRFVIEVFDGNAHWVVIRTTWLLLLLHICLICYLWNTQDSTEYNRLYGCFFSSSFVCFFSLSRIIFTVWARARARLNQKSNTNIHSLAKRFLRIKLTLCWEFQCERKKKAHHKTENMRAFGYVHRLHLLIYSSFLL